MRANSTEAHRALNKIQFWGALTKHNSVTVDITHGAPEIGKRTDGFGSNVDPCGQLYGMGRLG